MTLDKSRRCSFLFAVLAVAAPAAFAQSGSPDPFTYIVRNGVATNAVITSESRTVTGFEGTLPVGVSGQGNPQYSVNGAAYTSASGSITAGQTLRVRHTSSFDANTETVSTVAVGGYSTEFKSVTGATDRTPEPFDFGTKGNTPPSSFVESDPQTLGGFNTAIPIQAGNGAQYRVDSGTWTNANGTLNPGQVLQMRHVTASGELAYTKTWLKVGGITGYFTTRNCCTVNQAPIADAGPDQVVDENTDVTLDGSASSDAEGPVSHSWAQTEGPAVELAGANTANPAFTAPDVDGDTALTFELTVTDNEGATASDTVLVTVVDARVLSIADAQAVEGSGTIEFTVTVSPVAYRAITVDFATADGSAAAGDDYVAASGTLTIPAGAESALIVIPLVDDAFAENDETFTVGLSNAQGASIDHGIATGLIVDDDDTGLLRAGAARRSVTPTQAQIDGVVEPRIDGTTHKQRFNLGGFGVNPLQNLPDDPFGGMQQIGEALTEPASRRVFEGSRGPEHTHVRVLVLEQADGTRVAFVMLDAVGAGNLIQKGVKEAVNAAACEEGACIAPPGTPGEVIGNIVFGQTHTHAGADLQGLWGGVPMDWIQNVLYVQAAEAAREAVRGLRPARLTFRQGQNVAFNNYRRPRYDLAADADGTLTLVTATGDDGTPVGSILQYNAHPTSINEDPRIPHADYIQGAMDWLESAQTGPGGVALFYNGPIADASGSGSRPGCAPAPQDQDYGNVRCRGEGMANAAQQFAPRELAPTLEARHVEVTLPITNAGFVALGMIGSFNRYYDFLMLPAEQIPGIGPLVAAEMVNLPQLTPVARTLVSRVTLGGAEDGLEIVTIPGEATNTFGQYIRGLTGNRNMMLLGLTQNSFGYIIPEEEFNYVDPSGDAGFVAPFTGYEENVSLGPLTAPLLRLEGYHPLFDVGPDDPRNIPPPLLACMDDPQSEGCVLNNIGQRIDYIQRAYADQCRGFGGPEEFCALFDPQTPLYEQCIAAGFAEATCRALGTPGGGGQANPDVALAPAAADAFARGCDLLDPSHCLLPFPNDHFTVRAADGSPQAVAAGGTGRRVALNPAAMPRNAAGKPIDPSEWNRNDGFSPGQMIVTYVPGLGTLKDAQGNPLGPIKGAAPITDLSQSLRSDAPIFVMDVTEGAPEYGRKQLVWAEIDLNAGYVLPSEGVAQPPGRPARPALIIRPAKNLLEGHRYAVVLRNLQRDDGTTIPAGAAFAACLDAGFDSALPPVAARCAHLRQRVFPAIAQAGVALNPASLFLAWDFTVASAENNVGRLRHMRDDAFASLGDVSGLAAGDPGFPEGRAPSFTIGQVTDNPSATIARQVKGTFRVPSYVVPADPSPADGAGIPAPASEGTRVSAPPNRLFYLPDPTSAAACNYQYPGEAETAARAACLEQARYGDGLPDRNPAGDLTATFTCNIPRAALSGKTFATAGAADVKAARPSLYGHGLLGSHTEGGIGNGSGQAADFGNEQNVMFCATDWFGFAFGDIPNVATAIGDLSNFPVIPDGGQQGVVNFLFLARLMSHPDGFAGRPEFRVDARPVFDTREVFYDGNSQGGILGGPVVAMSRDIHRGVLGVPGMNYSTLLTRSIDFDLYSIPLYVNYQDDLDRNFLFSLIQMLWDRSENNGYAHHITDASALGTPDNEVLLHPAFADHQVSMWTAEVMARTIGAPVDRVRVTPARHPDDAEYFDIGTLDYGDAGAQRGSALVVWDNNNQPPPPIGNVPPREGSDPHGFPRGQKVGRCQKGHFLQRAGVLIEVPARDSVAGGFTCPPIVNEHAPDGEPPALGLPPADGRGLAGCVVNQDPALCQAALQSFADLSGCFEFDPAAFNCAYEVVHDALGVDTAADFLRGLFEQCAASPAAPACGAVRSIADSSDAASLAVLSRPIPRGDLVYAEQGLATPSVKTVDGDISDWMSAGTRIGGTDLYEFGEHVYSDFLFDAFGADDGADAQRWAALALAGQASSRTERVDALQQAGGDQLDVPAPAGTTADRYGDSANREDGTDLTEVRWAADGDDLYFLARVARLANPANLVVVVLADQDDTAGATVLNTGLATSVFDRAIVLRAGGGQIFNIAAGGAPVAIETAASAAGYDNALEARIPRAFVERPDGRIRVAVFTAREVGGSLVPANAAYRFDEPVTIYSERAQALALFARSVDPFLKQILVADLARGRTQSARPGFGYHERQFVSGANISLESDPENGRLQPYGVFVPSAPAVNTLNQARLTIWTHYRGGKTHSGASWTPRLFWQLGEEQGNLVVSPRARHTSSWYTTRAHQDFFEVFADVAGTGILRQYAGENLPPDHEFTEQGLFNVDPARVYVSGYSMGGFATYLFTGLYPDLFAGGFAQSGAVTQGAWTGVGPDDSRCQSAPQTVPFVNESGNVCFVEANAGRADAQLNYRILDNTRYVPITIHHGTNDELALTPGALRMGARLAELQYQYDATTFIGYEHFTQAIVDEWRDGAVYLNLHERPENPRAVTYKVVPALVEAVNEVQIGSWNGGQPFTFNPDGAYWVDGLVVRNAPRVNGGDPDPLKNNVVSTAFGRIDAESGRLPGITYVPAARGGAEADPDNPYASTPVFSPGNHSTPFFRHSLYWQKVGDIAGDANTFDARLVNLSAATLDLPRMGFTGHFDEPIDGSVSSDGAATLTLAKVGADVTVCLNGTATGSVLNGGNAQVVLAAGDSVVRLVPGLGAACGGGGTEPPAASPDRPDYADLCAAFGVPGSEPVCAALRQAETGLREGCEANGGPEGFCTLTGGNLHALVETCAANNPGEGALPACRIVDAFVAGAAGWCRQFSDASDGAQPHEFCALIGGVLVSEGELQRYEASWTHRALSLQNRLGFALPLVRNTVLHTHNSFNAQDDNTPPTLSGSDFNQYYDVTGQLRMDIRAIEMDVHWMPGRDGSAGTRGYEPMVCHGFSGSEVPPNFGCTTEKPLREALAELRAWLDAHPDEFVLLYIEDDIGGVPPPADASQAHGVTAQVIEDEIGELVYRPADHGAACGDGHDASVATSWLKVSRQQVLDAGRQVLLITETCAGGAWNDLFHQKNNPNWQQGTQGSYAGKTYAPGADNCLFREHRGKRFTRVWEDSTVVTATAGGGGPAEVTPEVMRELVRCGLNLPGVDRLVPRDGRLEAAVWSWAPDEPAASDALDCARHGASGRFFAADCAQALPYACVDQDDPHAWVVAGNGDWNAAACPSGYRFSVPANGFANEKLKEAKTAAGAPDVWLNYSDAAEESAWIGDAGAPPPGPAGEPPPPDEGLGATCRAVGLPEPLCAGLESFEQGLAALAGEPDYDQCEPNTGACVSDVPVAGNVVLNLLEPLLSPSDEGDPLTAALLAACRAAGVPELLCARAEDVAGGSGLSRWVDPRIGSYPPGFTNPGPVVPFGMVAVGPDTEGPIVYGGYYQHNALITGFSHVHMSAGVYKGGYFPVLPFTGGEPDTTDLYQGQDHPVPAYASAFDHATESALAGYYGVVLARYGVFAELTATERAGMHRYTFNDPARPGRVLFDVSRTLGGYRAAAVRLRPDGVLTGRVQASGFPVFFAARAGAPFTAATFGGAALAPGGAEQSGGRLGVVLDFPGAPSRVLLKVGVSYTDEAGALANLDAEIPGWDFDAVRAAARGKWDQALQAIEVEGGTDAERISFYTALYRLQHFPNLHSDVDGRYRGPDGAIHFDTRPHYSQFSSWDSYRGQNQMQAELFPARYEDMARSLLAFHQQAGHLPRWQEGPKDASHMSGDPIVPFIGEAWCRGGLDDALRAQLWPALTHLVDRREGELALRGYLSVPPAPLPDQVEGGPRGAGTTLEYGIADFALALMAQAADAPAAGAIAQRSLNYRNLLDPDTKWIRPRHDDGAWLTPFAPELGYGFQEGTSWQYSWLAMHDYAGVISRMGGDEAVNQRLDAFFNFPASAAAPLAWPTVQNQATVFGIAYYGNQYAPGNEHDLEAPYVYNYSGAAWRTQAVARAAASIYTPTPNGLPGNDDLGALSGWLLWTMAGVYPMNPGTPLAVIGSPVFEKVTLRRPGGDLVIEAPGASPGNKYVQSATLDGLPLERSWLLLPRGAATLRLEMGPAPNPAFGAAPAARPPSLSTHGLAAFGCSVEPLTADADADGFVDGADQCPGEAGTQNGCPLSPPPPQPATRDCLIGLDASACAAVAQDLDPACGGDPLAPGCPVDQVLVAALGEYWRQLPGATGAAINRYAPQAGEWPLATLADRNWTGTLRGPFRNDKPITQEGPGVDAGCPTGSSPAGVQACAASRVYYVHEPAGYTGAGPGGLPLVVYLHGCDQNAVDAAVGTRWSALADAQQFLVAYPEQRNGGFQNSYTNQGNSTSCWNWYDPVQGQGHADLATLPGGAFYAGYIGNEPKILRDIVGDVSANWNVDPQRVYVLGASAGADMAMVMAANFADVFAAAGSLAGCPYPDCAMPPEAGGALIGSRWQPHGRTRLPLFAGQGTLDTLSPAPLTELLVQEWLAAHDFVNGPTAVQSRLPAATRVGAAAGDGNGYDYRVDSWRDPAGCDVVERWLVYGFGHAYPGGDGRGSFTLADGPDATRAAWEFFRRHTLATGRAAGCG